MFTYITKTLSYSLVLFASELAYRLIVQIPIETFHHNVALKSTLQDVLRFNPTAKTFGTFALVVCAICTQHTQWWSTLSSSDSVAMFLAYFICRSVSMHQSPSLEQLHFVRQSSGLDYGSGMALSYFFGYLKIVLASTESSDSKNIKERLEDYEDAQQINIPVKKLFILVPYSMYTPGKLTSDTLEVARNLETIVLNRGGIANRTYHNTVYKIKGTNWYVPAEGASPLLTFYQAMATSDLLKKNRDAIAASFVAKLRQMLWDDCSCRNLCEVIHFDDHKEDGEEFDYGLLLKNIMESKLNAA